MPTTKKPVTPTKKKVTNKKAPTTKKKAIKKKVVRKTTAKKKEFIDIYETDPVVDIKSKLSWMIVGGVMIILVFFGFWSMKMSIDKSNADADLSGITTEINKSVEEFREIVSDTKSMIEHANDDLLKQQEIESIKNDVLRQIQVNLESENWPTHISGLIDLSFKYPENWNKTEDATSIVISSYDTSATSSPELFGSITIQRSEGLDVVDTEIYTKTDDEIFIDLLPVKKYKKTDSELKDISYIITVPNSYTIEVYSKNGKNLFEPIINKILSTIELL
jgi:hypothetical protein